MFSQVTQNSTLSPVDYSLKYNLSYSKLSREIGISENAVQRYFLSESAKSKGTPDNRTLRIIQLLDFIKSNGLIPPDSDF